MSKLEFLNRITTIIVNAERVVLSSRQLDQVIELQEELADELAIQNSEFSLAALVILQVFYYMRGEGDSALSVEFSAPALRGEVCEKAQEIWNRYKSNFPDERFLLSMYSTDEELEVLQRALDGDAEAQNDLSHLFESMNNQDAANYWLKRAMSVNEEEKDGLYQDQPYSQHHDNQKTTDAAPLNIIVEDREQLEGDTQDSNAETENGQDISVIEKKDIPQAPTPFNSDTEPEVLSEPQDATLIIESQPNQEEVVVSPTNLVSLSANNADKEPDLVEFFRLDNNEIEQTSNQPPERFPRETIRGLEMKAEWEESYRLLKSESPMIISTRTTKITVTEANQENIVDQEEEEDEVFYEAQDCELVENSMKEDDLIQFLDGDLPQNMDNTFNQTASFNYKSEELKVQSIDRLSPEVIQQLEHDAENQARGKLAISSSPSPAPFPGVLKLSPEEVEKIQSRAEEEEEARLLAVDVNMAKKLNGVVDNFPDQPREVEYADFIKAEESSCTSDEVSSESMLTNEDSAEFEVQTDLAIERIEVAVSTVFQDDQQNLLGDEITPVLQNNDTVYPNDIVEAYTNQIDTLSAESQENGVDNQDTGMIAPLDTIEIVERISSQYLNDDDVILVDKRRESHMSGSKTDFDGIGSKVIDNLKKDLLYTDSEVQTDAQDALEPLPAVIRERQPAGTPSMEILPYPKPDPVPVSSAVVKAPTPSVYAVCCSWIPFCQPKNKNGIV